jgi:hypothetical protein
LEFVVKALCQRMISHLAAMIGIKCAFSARLTPLLAQRMNLRADLVSKSDRRAGYLITGTRAAACLLHRTLWKAAICCH